MSGKIYQGSRLVAQTNDAPLGFEDKGIELESLAQYEQLEKDGNLQEDVNYYIKDTKVIMRNNEKYSDIDDSTVSMTSTYSSDKIEEVIMPEKVELPQSDLFPESGNRWTINTNKTQPDNYNRWSNSNSYYGAIVDLAPYKHYKAIRLWRNSSNLLSTATFLKTGTPVAGEIPDFTDSYYGVMEGVNDWYTGDFLDVAIPEDANYVFIYCVSQSVIYRPDKVEFLPVYDTAYCESKFAKPLISNVDISTLTSCGGTMTGDPKAWLASTGYEGALIDLTSYKLFNRVTITTNANGRGTDVAFTTAGFSAGTAVSFATGWTTSETIPAPGTPTKYTYDIPSDAKYLYVYLHSGDTDYTPSAIQFSVQAVSVTENIVVNPNVGVMKGLAPTSLKVCTYNIGHFGGGSHSTPQPAYIARLDEYREMIYDTIGADLININEYSTPITGVGKTRDVVFDNFGVAYEGPVKNNGWTQNAFFGNTCILNTKQYLLDCLKDETITHTTAITAQGYYTVESDLYMKGRLVKYVVCHLAFDSNRPGVLQAKQINELITRYADYKRVILVADWNVNDFSEMAPFTTAGYTLANDGTYITYPNSSGGIAMDTVVVKGLTVSNPGRVVSDLSDHYPFYCTVTLTDMD